MPRRARKVAPGRGRGRSGRAPSRGLSAAPILLVALAAAALVVLWNLRPSPRPAPPPPDAPLPGVEVAEPPAPHPPARASAPDVREASRSASAPAPVATRALPSVAPAGPRADASPVTARGPALPRIAIVLDDCGQRLDLLERAVRIRQPLTFAVIPHLPHSRSSAEAAFAAGHEVIVHQPMEPESGEENPGDGVLTTGMSAAEVQRTLKASLLDVPHAVGLNNHMGSRATSDARLMAALFSSLPRAGRGRPLYFLDSRTSAATVARAAAQAAGVPSAQRDVFLDNDLEPAAILGQLDALVARAAAEGQAIGIGHLKPETLGVLEAALPRVEGSQARFVFLGDLMR